MDIGEVIGQLQAIKKVYAGIMPQSQFSNTIARIKAGICKDKTKVEFLAKFGYFKKTEEWEKKIK